MSKRTTPTKLGLGLLVALTLSTVSMSAHAGCKWYDAKCLAKEVRDRAEAAANAARALAEQQAAAARAHHNHVTGFDGDMVVCVGHAMQS